MKGALVWLTFARARGVGRTRLAKLMEACPDPADAWRLSPYDLSDLEGWDLRLARTFLAVRTNAEARRGALDEIQSAMRAGLRLVLLTDPTYPVRLRQTPEPPPYFYQTGPWSPDARPVVAIVGSRKPTSYGLAVAERFGRELGERGAVVVSGMARGIDCAAHRGALASGAQTVAVLGGGADVCYPREARPIYRQIRESGAVISEFPPGTQPRPEHFPQRNRIISGLSHGVVVVEAGERSGTLLTVSAALNQGRDVFAVPGPVTSPLSLGPHRLIQEGAALATSVDQILQELGFAPGQGAGSGGQAEGLTREEAQLLAWMGDEPRWAQDLAVAQALEASQVQALLTLLELKGRIRRLPDGQYTRIG